MPEIKWNDPAELGLPRIEGDGDFSGAKVIPWIPGMKTNIADCYFMTWHTGDIRRYYEAGGKAEKLVVHFLSFDTGVIAPLWGHSYHDRVKRMKEFKVHTVLSPDFSSWITAPLAVQFYNYYKSNVVTRDLKTSGFKIIPNICWSHTKLLAVSLDQWGPHKVSLVDMNHVTEGGIWTQAFELGLKYYHDRFPKTPLAVYCNTKNALSLVKKIHTNCFWVATRGGALSQMQRVGKRLRKTT